MNLNSLRQQSIKNQMIIYASGYTLVFASILYFVLLPAVKDIKNIRAQILSHKIEMELRMARDKNISKVNDKLTVIEPQLSILNKIFISPNREIEFIMELEEIAAKHNISQKININPAGAKQENSYKKNAVEISMQGSYYNIINYFSDLEKLSYYINITNLEITSGAADKSRDAEGSESSRVNVKFIANTYWK